MWQIAVISRVVMAYIIMQFLLKSIVSEQSRTKKFLLMFTFTLLLSIVATPFLHSSLTIDSKFFTIITIGFVSTWATYCYWRAVDISMSATAVFTQADDIIAIGLANIVLGEWRSIHLILGLLLVLCFVVVLIYSLLKRKNLNITEKNKWTSLTLWIAGYSVVWGCSFFTTRYFAVTGTSKISFVLAWYLGAFVASVIIYVSTNEKKQKPTKMSKSEIVKVFALSAIVWVCMLLQYWANELIELTISQPIFQVSEIVFPFMIGYWFFKENQELNKTEKILFIVGVLGALAILLIG